jgi:hypothetical protein
MSRNSFRAIKKAKKEQPQIVEETAPKKAPTKRAKKTTTKSRSRAPKKEAAE